MSAQVLEEAVGRVRPAWKYCGVGLLGDITWDRGTWSTGSFSPFFRFRFRFRFRFFFWFRTRFRLVSSRLVSFSVSSRSVSTRFRSRLLSKFSKSSKKLEKILTQKNLDSFPVAEEVALSWCLAGSAFVAAK